jgi:hypothetical protein
MEFSTHGIENALAPARAYSGLDVRALDREALLAAHNAIAAARRAADVVLAGLAGEIARRSTPDAPGGGLARGEGFGSAQRMIAAKTGGSLGDAGRLMEAGAALSEGGPIARALAAGAIGVEAAALVRSTVARLDDPDGVHEARLVAKASDLSLQDLRRVCTRYEAFADSRAWRERELRQRGARCVTVGTDHEGMTVITARLDPPSAAPVIAWLDAQVREAFQRRRDDAVGGPGHSRSAGQIRADALVALARHGLGCDQPGSGVTTTVVVRIGLEELRAGVGLGDCDHLSAPVSAAAVRAMAADAEVIPLVLGGASEPLDLGRARRLFSRAQRLALVERDGGCAWCHAPPSYCDAHHIRWWDKHGGRTDLDNGLMLCVSCHHRLHDTGWDVRVQAGRVSFVPPADVDPERRPRLGGRARLEVGSETAGLAAAVAA